MAAEGEALKNALLYKGSGNKQLAEGSFKRAAEEYSNGLEWLEELPCETEAVREVKIALLSNRSHAMIKQLKWSEALWDAEAVLVLDRKHSKARFRKAKALMEMQRYYEAKAELDHLIAAEPSNEDVNALLCRAEELLAKGSTEEDQINRSQTKKEKPKQEQTWDAEARRLLQVSDDAYKSNDFKEALERVDNAVALCEAHVDHVMLPQDFQPLVRSMFAKKAPVDLRSGAKETTELIAAYSQRSKCLLALHDFQAAGETASRALKLFDWQKNRLATEFNDSCGLQSASTIVEALRSVSFAATSLDTALSGLSAGRFTEAHAEAFKALERLESKRDWPVVAPLRAELYAVRGASALRHGDPVAAETDAELALSIDGRCARARDVLREINNMCK